MNKKTKIEVRFRGKPIAMINRVLRAEMMGNFNPFLSNTHHKQVCLLLSPRLDSLGLPIRDNTRILGLSFYLSLVIS